MPFILFYFIYLFSFFVFLWLLVYCPIILNFDLLILISLVQHELTTLINWYKIIFSIQLDMLCHLFYFLYLFLIFT